MPLIVVGGHSRNVGKTSVVAGLIAALSELRWTAFKITQHGHGICSANGEPCDCATGDHTVAISEEKDAGGRSDTSRYLKAGAVHAWWVRTRQGHLAEAMPRVRKIVLQSQDVIIESNSVLAFLNPDLYLTVLDPATEDFKASSQMFLDRADAVLLHATGNSEPRWKNVSLKTVRDVPVFAIVPPDYCPPAVVSFVRQRLAELPAKSETPSPHAI